MEFSLILFSLLFFTTWMNLVQAMNGPVNECPCVFFSKTKVPYTDIKRYLIQKEGICSFRAIVFWTKRGKMICSDPEDEWAKKVVEELDKRQKETTLTPGSPPPASPTSVLSTALAEGTEPASTSTEALSVPAIELSSQTSLPASEPTPTSTTLTPKTTAQRSHPPSTPTIAQPSTTVTLRSSSLSSTGSEPTPTSATSTPKTTAPRSQPPSTPTSAQLSTTVTLSSSSSSLPGSETTPTLSPSTTATLSTPASELSVTSTPIFATLVSTSTPKRFATVPRTSTVSDRMPAASMRKQKAFTGRRSTTRRIQRKKNFRKWQINFVMYNV